ncbi:MAG: hypothetical protein ACP5I4_17225 [Oceanipulchritudo sp.]
MKTHLLLALGATALTLTATAQVSITGTGTPYIQDFSSLSTDTNVAQAWADNSTLPGWYLLGSNSGTPADYTPQWESGINASVFYHARNTTDTETSFIGARTGSGIGNASYGLRMVNNTGATLTSFDLTFTASQFYKTGVAQQMRVYYSTNATSLATGTWSEITEAAYIAPYTTGNATVSAAEELAAREIISISGAVAAIAPAGDIWIKWVSYRDQPGGGYTAGSAVLAVTNVSVTFSDAPILASTEDFTSLSTVTGASTPWTDDSTIPGWYLYSSVAAAAPTAYVPQWETGVSATGFYHNRNTTESEPRKSFLSARTGTAVGDASYGVRIANTSGSPLISVDISYLASQFYKTTVAQQMRVYVSSDATSLASGTWTEVPALLYTAPHVGTANGNVTGAEELSARSLRSATGVTINSPAGGNLWIKWVSYRDEPGGAYSAASAVLAISDVSVTAYGTSGTPVFVEVYLETSTDLQNWVPADEGLYDVSGTPRFFRAQVVPQ